MATKSSSTSITFLPANLISLRKLMQPRFFPVVSARWVGEKPVIRIGHSLTASAVATLSDKFADVLQRGSIVHSKALPQEKNEPEIRALPRLVLTPHRRSFGRFRQLIGAINRAECTRSLEGSALSRP